MAKVKLWFTSKWNPVNKSVTLYGPDGFVADIDYDDVDHKTVRRVGQKMVEILNSAWPAWPACILVCLLLGACATGNTPAPFVPGPVNPLASIAVRVGAADACDQATRTGGGPALLAKVSAAEALVTSGDVLAAVEQALLAGADARRAFYLDLIIQAIQTSGNLPKTVALTPGSPAAQLVAAALAGCRAGVGLNASSGSRVKVEALEAPAPSLSAFMYKAGYTESIAKGSNFFDSSLSLDQRLVHGKIDTSAPSGTNERIGLDPSRVKGPMVGPEGVSCDVVQWWITNVGPSFGVPATYFCTASDLWDALYTKGRDQNAWNDVYLSAYIAGHPIVVATPPTPGPVNPVCLSGGCFPDRCPQNCTTVPPVPPAPPVVPGCPAPPAPHSALVLPPRVADTLKQLAAGHTVLNPGRYREVATFFARHSGLLVP